VHGPQYRLIPEGRAQVLTKLQSAQEGGVLASGRVLEGQVSQGSFARISRNRRAVWTGRISRLRVAKGAGPAAVGQECLLGFGEFRDFRPGDLVEVFQLESTT
jgi:translation initiation factor IF-2